VAGVWVAGSINMDLIATAPRHPAVGETVLGHDLARLPGGKGANQAVAAARSGAPTRLVGAVGDDAFGTELRTYLNGQGIATGTVVTKADKPTGTALIVVADADNTIVVVPGANAALGDADAPPASAFAAGDVVVAQLETPQATTIKVFAAAHARGATTILNAAPAALLDTDLLPLIDLLVVNESERELLRNQLDGNPPITVICTLGANGVSTTTSDGSVIVTEGRKVDAVDTTGAGDCFVGYLAAGLASGRALTAAIERANSAAALSVQRTGAAPSIPTAAEVDQLG
jgi:ribokinase